MRNVGKQSYFTEDTDETSTLSAILSQSKNHDRSHTLNLQRHLLWVCFDIWFTAENAIVNSERTIVLPNQTDRLFFVLSSTKRSRLQIATQKGEPVSTHIVIRATTHNIFGGTDD